MSAVDYILIALIILAAAAAFRKIRKNRRNGGCSCGCAGCTAAGCPQKMENGTNNPEIISGKE